MNIIEALKMQRDALESVLARSMSLQDTNQIDAVLAATAGIDSVPFTSDWAGYRQGIVDGVMQISGVSDSEIFGEFAQYTLGLDIDAPGPEIDKAVAATHRLLIAAAVMNCRSVEDCHAEALAMDLQFDIDVASELVHSADAQSTARLAWLHRTNKDSEGYEYGVAKVKKIDYLQSGIKISLDISRALFSKIEKDKDIEIIC